MILSRSIRYHLVISSGPAKQDHLLLREMHVCTNADHQWNEAERSPHIIHRGYTAIRPGVSLPVARTTGWNFGTSGDRWACRVRRAAGEPVCLPPWRGGQRQSPVRATLWGSARHPPPKPATASTCFTLRLRFPLFYPLSSLMSALGALGIPFFRPFLLFSLSPPPPSSSSSFSSRSFSLMLFFRDAIFF